MRSYRRPLMVIAAATAISTLMSACVVVPARGYYRYHYRYYGEAKPAQVVPQAAAPEASRAPTEG
ncbi:hypothetical protein AACH06_04290 [Ideonella sp. DXS29W]|uniref:Lipoprotein n=1 Tax=Ideonella lacteola TaxID=2984193 RepID=A0ABU9BKL2_9BURK